MEAHPQCDFLFGSSQKLIVGLTHLYYDYLKICSSLIIFNVLTLVVKDGTYDYQGRSWLHPPQDVGVSLKADSIPEKCFIPKRLIHTWSGHTKAVNAIRWFPVSAHLLLSSSMDCKIKVSFTLSYQSTNPKLRSQPYNSAE